MNLFERDIAVDMGTSSTLLFEQGKGVVAREPTVVAVDKFSGRILKIGQDAQRMLGRTPANIVAIHPINAGVISDYEITAQMLRELVSRITSFSLFKPCILACVPSSITGVEGRGHLQSRRTHDNRYRRRHHGDCHRLCRRSGGVRVHKGGGLQL